MQGPRGIDILNGANLLDVRVSEIGYGEEVPVDKAILEKTTREFIKQNAHHEQEDMDVQIALELIEQVDYN